MGYANEASHQATAEELLELMNTDEIVGQLFAQMEQVLEHQFIKMKAPDSERPVLKKYKNILLMVLKGEINWEKMKNDFIKTYTNRYTENELKAMTESCKASSGEFIEKMPELMLEEIIIAQKKMPELMNKTQQINMEMIDELRQRQLKQK